MDGFFDIVNYPYPLGNDLNFALKGMEQKQLRTQ